MKFMNAIKAKLFPDSIAMANGKQINSTAVCYYAFGCNPTKSTAIVSILNHHIAAIIYS